MAHKKSKTPAVADRGFIFKTGKVCNLLNLLYDGLESLGVVHSEVGENLTVDLDTCLSEVTHEYRVAETLLTSGSVDTLNPQRTEVALLVTTITIGVGQTLLPCVLCYCPNILAGSEVAAGKLQNSLTLCS